MADLRFPQRSARLGGCHPDAVMGGGDVWGKSGLPARAVGQTCGPQVSTVVVIGIKV